MRSPSSKAKRKSQKSKVKSQRSKVKSDRESGCAAFLMRNGTPLANPTRLTEPFENLRSLSVRLRRFHIKEAAEPLSQSLLTFDL
jgi:hypothetical protein